MISDNSLSHKRMSLPFCHNKLILFLFSEAQERQSYAKRRFAVASTYKPNLSIDAI